MFRLCVVGSGGVGKSSLTIRYLKNEFTEVRPCDLGMPLLKWCVQITSKEAQMHIWLYGGA